MTLAFVPSTIPSFRVALLAALTARTGLAGVALCDGRPESDILGGEEFLALMDTEFEISAPTMNRTTQPREEVYTQQCWISVNGQTSNDQVTLGTRCFAIFAELCDQLRATPHLEGFYPSSGSGQIASALIDTGSYFPRADDREREATLQFGIRVTARLQ